MVDSVYDPDAEFFPDWFLSLDKKDKEQWVFFLINNAGSLYFIEQHLADDIVLVETNKNCRVNLQFKMDIVVAAEFYPVEF